MADEADFDKKKAHNKRHAGRKADKKAAKNKHVQDQTARERNPKAFSFHSAVKAQRQFSRTQDIKTKKHHIPVVDRAPLEPPPIVVAVVGGPKVGKSTLVRCLIRNFTSQKLTDIKGPVTIVAGKKKKFTFIEVNSDINCMIDIAKVADIVLMLIDATFGIEMEVFEFLEICRAHGTPRIMGILNHLDMMKDNKILKKKKKSLKHRFQIELYPGAKLFFLSGIIHGEYLKNEIKNLGRFITVMNFRPLTWRTTHPYVLVDRYEDITNPESIRLNPKCDRGVVLYGYVRGVPLQKSQMVHIPGCGDYKLKDISFLPDPCPLPSQLKKRALNAKEKLTYAPMSGVGGVVYDKDAVYIDLGGSHHQKAKLKEIEDEDGDEEGFDTLLNLQMTTDEKQAESRIQLFSQSQFISTTKEEEEESDDEEEDEEEEDDEDEMDTSGIQLPPRKGLPKYETVEDSSGRVRRRAIFDDGKNEEEDESSDEDEDEDELDDEENEGEDESEDEEQENELAPPKKKIKNTSFSQRKQTDSDNDSDDCDVDGDLKNIVKDHPRTDDPDTPLRKDKSEVERRKLSQKALKNNKNLEVASKIQDILEKISTVKKSKRPKSRAISDDSGFSNEEADSASEAEEEEEDFLKPKQEHKEDSEEEEEEEKENEKLEFRDEMFKQATENFYKNQSTVSYLRKYIYGDIKEEEEKSDEEEEEDHVAGMFRRVAQVKRSSNQHTLHALMDELDSSRYIAPVVRNWSDSELLDTIRNCFMTGEWKDGENAEALLKMDDEDQDLYGDFEDLETGQKYEAEDKEEDKTEGAENEDNEAEPEAKKKKEDMSKREKYLEKKRRLKEMFDTEYDDKGGDHFNTLKAEMSQQAQLNRSEFQGLDDETRVKYEGYRPGMYVRMEFSKFPCEFITNFDSNYPVIVGGLLDNESNMGFVRIRIKVHRWYPKILKNRDPLIFSLGWRRFQTMVYYAKREDNFVMRSLKYAKKYLHVEAMFWGPLTTVSTGFVTLQNISDRSSDFRIAASGVVLEGDQSCKIVKRLRLVGAPSEVKKKLAIVKDMFHSETEVAKFIGAKLQTQSGIRGILKKAHRKEGFFRASFEDTIKKSDVVLMKTWVPLVLNKYCTTVRTLLLPAHQKAQWQGMKTVGQIKREKGIKNPVNPDNLYEPITQRREYIKKPLRIPAQLQKALPYTSKPKFTPKQKKADRVLVVKDPHEIEMDMFMQRLKTMMANKMEKDQSAKAERMKKYEEQLGEELRRKNNRLKARKKAVCRKIGKKSGSNSLT